MQQSLEKIIFRYKKRQSAEPIYEKHLIKIWTFFFQKLFYILSLYLYIKLLSGK